MYFQGASGQRTDLTQTRFRLTPFGFRLLLGLSHYSCFAPSCIDPPTQRKRHAWDSLALPENSSLLSLVVIFASQSPGETNQLQNDDFIVWDMHDMEPVNRHRQSEVLLRCLKYTLKCCLHKWKEFESISLRPSNSPEMAAAGTASMHGSTRNHSFCLRTASEWVFVFAGTQRGLLKLQPHWQCKFASYFASIESTRNLTHANAPLLKLWALPPSVWKQR